MLARRRLLQSLAWAVGLLLAGGGPLFAASLTAIQARGYLVVAVKDNLYPLGYRVPDGSLAGFEVDLARELARALFGDPGAVRFVAVRNQDRLAVLERGEADLVIADWSLTVPRARAVDFSLPYLSIAMAVLLRQDSPVRRLSDLDGLRLAVLANSSSERALQTFLPAVRRLPVSSYQAGVEAVTGSEADGFAADETVLLGWVRNRPGFRLFATNLDANGLAIGMPRGLATDDLRRWVNSQLARLLKAGWLAERASAYGLISMP